MSKDEILNGEFDWFASDNNGHIAHFSSGGTHIAPLSVKNNLDNQVRLEGLLKELPIVTKAIIKSKDHNNDWYSFAQKGIFSYDIKHWDGPYFLVAAPEKPIRLYSLPKEVQSLLKQVCIQTSEFRQLSEINVKDFLQR